MTTIYIESNGCTRRKLDVSRFHAYFRANGYRIVSNPKDADYILVTTCAFKKSEEDHSLELIERLQKNSGTTVVYGCLPEIAPARFSPYERLAFFTPREIDKIDDFFPGITHRFADIGETNLLSDDLTRAPLGKAVGKFVNEFELSTRFASRTLRYAAKRIKHSDKEYFLFTSRGCLGSCSYCAVRFAVGPIQSKPIPLIVKEFVDGVMAGHRNFILVGDDVGAYGLDRDSSFPELLSALLAELTSGEAAGVVGPDGHVRLHIDEFNPRWLIRYQDDLLQPIANGVIGSVVCPLQSGNERILKLMLRGHDAASAFDAMDNIAAANPELQLSSQIIVGFPTETDAEFDQTLERLAASPCRSVTLFPYDEKENTPAAAMEPKVPADVIARRVARAEKELHKSGIATFMSCQES